MSSSSTLEDGADGTSHWSYESDDFSWTFILDIEDVDDGDITQPQRPTSLPLDSGNTQLSGYVNSNREQSTSTGGQSRLAIQYATLGLTSAAGISAMISAYSAGGLGIAALATVGGSAILVGGVFGIIGAAVVLSGLVYEMSRKTGDPQNPMLAVSAVNNMPGQVVFATSIACGNAPATALQDAQIASDVRSIYRGRTLLKSNPFARPSLASVQRASSAAAASDRMAIRARTRRVRLGMVP